MTYICTQDLHYREGAREKVFTQYNEYEEIAGEKRSEDSLLFVTDLGTEMECTAGKDGWKQYFVLPEEINTEELEDVIAGNILQEA